MTKESDESQSQDCGDNKQSNQLASTTLVALNVGVPEKSVGYLESADVVGIRQEGEKSNTLYHSKKHNEAMANRIGDDTKEQTLKLNDLVADLCISGISHDRSADKSDSAVPVGVGECAPRTIIGDYKNIRATEGPGGLSDAKTSNLNATQSHTQNTFSFKRFLSGDASSLHCAPSSTVTSLDVPATQQSAITTINTASCSLQTSTGARPKVPQSSSFSASGTNSSMMSGNLNVAGAASKETVGSSTKMKRSPRFSSFDSQASLAGSAAAASVEEEAGAISNSNSSDRFRSHPFVSNAGNMNCDKSSYNYGKCFVLDERPNRLSFAPSSTKQRILEAHRFPGELSTDAPPNRSMAGELPASAAAAGLPDFVQDHWMDSWYASEMHLNSPPNSPICDFIHDLLADGAVGAAGAGAAAAAGVSVESSASLDMASSAADAGTEQTSSQRLPDFLSDGPIIHSSQRLADVAAGLPSNSMNSPEETALKQQLNNLRVENERQRSELNDTRSALAEQTRRANEYERQLLELQRRDAVEFNQSTLAQIEEDLEHAKRRQSLSRAHVRSLKQQIKDLTSEVISLRRENESLREGGAVGGCSKNKNCDRQCTIGMSAAAGSVSGAVGGGSGALGNKIRPSRSQQISRDLRRAASNAENNLRKLLSGVDNLRQMATDIEKADLRLEYGGSPDLFSNFPDESDDFKETPGGGSE